MELLLGDTGGEGEVRKSGWTAALTLRAKNRKSSLTDSAAARQSALLYSVIFKLAD